MSAPTTISPRDIGDVRILDLPIEGAPLSSEGDARDLIGRALETGARLIAIPTIRLADDFFDLKTRNAGEFLQKMANYRIRLAIIGDISAHTERSNALKDFVTEANRGGQVWFLSDDAALIDRLAAESEPE